MRIKRKSSDRHREQTYGCQGGWWERDGVGVWGQQMQTIICGRDKQQGPNVQHRELYSIFYDKPMEKNILKKKAYICITESLCCTAEINTTL